LASPTGTPSTVARVPHFSHPAIAYCVSPDWDRPPTGETAAVIRGHHRQHGLPPQPAGLSEALRGLEPAHRPDPRGSAPRTPDLPGRLRHGQRQRQTRRHSQAASRLGPSGQGEPTARVHSGRPSRGPQMDRRSPEGNRGRLQARRNPPPSS
jgi:hypothetical protein